MEKLKLTHFYGKEADASAFAPSEWARINVNWLDQRSIDFIRKFYLVSMTNTQTEVYLSRKGEVWILELPDDDRYYPHKYKYKVEALVVGWGCVK